VLRREARLDVAVHSPKVFEKEQEATALREHRRWREHGRNRAQELDCVLRQHACCLGRAVAVGALPACTEGFDASFELVRVAAPPDFPHPAFDWHCEVTAGGGCPHAEAQVPGWTPQLTNRLQVSE
tara:strand:- start:546 stop:923 length:378 start_codon:yes stop_codon:yes gene_type:complete